MSLNYLLLGLLGTPRSGYELSAEFEAGVGHFWSAELSQIYRTLKALRRDGWVRDHLEGSDKGPDRRVYRRTAAGTRALRKWLTDDPQFGDERCAWLAQVYFLNELPDARHALRALVQLREQLVVRLDALRAIEKAWAEQSPEYPDRLPPEDFFPQLTLQLGLRVAEARLTWCVESIRRVRSRLKVGGASDADRT